jgi:hypothetical protein
MRVLFTNLPACSSESQFGHLAAVVNRPGLIVGGGAEAVGEAPGLVALIAPFLVAGHGALPRGGADCHGTGPEQGSDDGHRSARYLAPLPAHREAFTGARYRAVHPPQLRDTGHVWATFLLTIVYTES